jgi:hypothetical protein
MIVGFLNYQQFTVNPYISFDMLIQKNDDFPNYEYLYMNISLYNQSNITKETKLEINCTFDVDIYQKMIQIVNYIIAIIMKTRYLLTGLKSIKILNLNP